MRATVKMYSPEAGIYTITYKKTLSFLLYSIFMRKQNKYIGNCLFLARLRFLRIGSNTNPTQLKHLKSNNLEMLMYVCVCMCLTACLSVHLYECYCENKNVKDIKLTKEEERQQK